MKIIAEDKHGWPVEQRESLTEQTDDSFIAEVDIEIYGSDLREKYNQKVSVKYQLDFEMRSWGMKSLLPIVPDQEISVILVEEKEDEEIEIEKKIEIKDVSVDIRCGDIRGSIGLLPVSLEIHMDRKKATLNFEIS